MPWIKKNTHQHGTGGCFLPDSVMDNVFTGGSVWECPVCNKRWLFLGYNWKLRKDSWEIIVVH